MNSKDIAHVTEWSQTYPAQKNTSSALGQISLGAQDQQYGDTNFLKKSIQHKIFILFIKCSQESSTYIMSPLDPELVLLLVAISQDPGV